MAWTRALLADELPSGEARELVVGERIVAIFNVAGEYFALDGICPHQGGPLGKGRLQGCVVTCPWHGWQFDVRTGQHQANLSIRHAAWPVKVEQGELWVDLPASASG